jgi:hypothetical protein
VKKPLRERKLHTPARAQEKKPLSDKNRTKVAGWLESQPTLKKKSLKSLTPKPG